jgi:hypothetical protein
MDKVGAKKPPGIPDRVEAKVAMNFSGAKLKAIFPPSTATRAGS